jgi:hypothetical protein
LMPKSAGLAANLLHWLRATPNGAPDPNPMDSLRGGGRHRTLPRLVDVAAVRPLDRMLLSYDEPIDR